MAYDLPSLNALRAFEATARHLSFKEAARELYVTPGAVSQQVKALEEALGLILVRRLTRAIELTEAGHTLLATLRDSFQRISETVESLVERDTTGPLTISVLPSLAAKWLVPRLGRFQARHPDIDVRISASNQFTDFAREDVDLGIRHGLGEYPGLRSDLLLPGELLAVCSPALLKGPLPLKSPRDLRHHTLLHADPRVEWSMWLKTHGVEGVNAGRGPRFSDDGLMLRAAIEGQGVAISSRALVADDLAAGRLVRPFALNLSERFAYFLVCPEATVDRPKIVAFREWILAEARAELTEEGQAGQAPPPASGKQHVL
ncbi:MAG: transcriptional regulator GcvA [SAR324 cluster bacterium]|nr:transcriptional regulator GcvA [SAR324 cluster bacterium]